MSDDKNLNESVEEVVENVKETVEEVVETVTEKVEEVAENVTDAVEESGAVAKIMALKDSNPKVFFGAIGGLVVVILLLLMSGGGKNPLPQPKQVNLVNGNTYTLKGVNSYGADAKIRLVAVPGSMAAYDESEKEGKEGNCKSMPEGTKVKLLSTQEALGGVTFVELEILDAKGCEGRKGWTTANDLN